MKKHRFTIVVRTNQVRRQAERALLVAFASRQPDYMEFNLLRKQPKGK